MPSGMIFLLYSPVDVYKRQIVDGENTKFGTPVVEGAKVEATVVKNGKGKKVRVYKYKAKKDVYKRQS